MLESDVLADFRVEAEFDAHAFEDFTAAGHHRLFHLEFGNAEGEQATDFRILVEDHRLDAVAHQNVGTAEAGRTGADDGDLLVRPLHLGHVGTPAHGKGGVDDVLLGVADGDGAEAVVQRAGTFAEAVLRANTATDFRQRVGLVAELGGLEQVAFRDQLQPVRNVVVDRALPFAVRVAAAQAAMRLVLDLFLLERMIDFHEGRGALVDFLLGGILTRHIEKLEIVVQAFCHLPLPQNNAGEIRRGSTAVLTYCYWPYIGFLRVLFSSSLMLAAFGFTSQNLRRYSSNFLSISSPQALPVSWTYSAITSRR
ncbi:MAG: hypothetical protein K0S16_2378 [Moraxellaceae bacterium]|nr:hypothetical protein [Moraxellaceae bacterium]